VDDEPNVFDALTRSLPDVLELTLERLRRLALAIGGREPVRVRFHSRSASGSTADGPEKFASRFPRRNRSRE
jgi:hypothetical protein